MSEEANNNTYDFSSKGRGQVTTLESFLEDTPDATSTEDVVTATEPTLEDFVEVVPDGEEDGGLDLSDLNSKDDEVVVEDKEKGDDAPLPPSTEVDLENIVDKKGTVDYKSLVQKMIDNNLWEGIEAFETEEGEVSFEDMDIDEETYLAIYKQNEERRKEELLKDTVTTKGTSEFTQTLLEIEQNGGNVQQALESYNKYKNPIDNLDLDLVADQKSAIYLKYQAKGLEAGEINSLIESYESKGILQDQAVQAKANIETAFKQQMKSINDQAVQEKEARKEALKTYKSSLGESLKDYNLSDTYRRKLMDVAAKEDAEGNYQLDKIYTELRQDPVKAAELVLFLTDKDEYIKQITANVSREKDIKTMQKIKMVPKSKSSVNITKSDDNKSKDKNLVSLEFFK